MSGPEAANRAALQMLLDFVLLGCQSHVNWRCTVRAEKIMSPVILVGTYNTGWYLCSAACRRSGS